MSGVLRTLRADEVLVTNTRTPQAYAIIRAEAACLARGGHGRG
jgi:hypothetical protein